MKPYPALPAFLLLAPLAPAQTITRDSVEPGGFELQQGGSSPSLSEDARWIAFLSAAPELSGTSVHRLRVFIRDRVTGAIVHASVHTSGAVGNDHSGGPDLSANGRWVAYHSQATNLVDGDGNGTFDVFVHDRIGGVTELVSVALGGGPGTGPSLNASVSADGRYVAFESGANDLVAGDLVSSNVFVRDRFLGVTVAVDLAPNGAFGDAHGTRPAISGDGRHVAFLSRAGNLVPGVAGGTDQVYVSDRIAGTVELVSVTTSGNVADLDCFTPAISRNGRFVTFMSAAPSLDPLLSTGVDAFLRDRFAGTLAIASPPAGVSLLLCYGPAPVTDDGRYVVFGSNDLSLALNDVNGTRPDVFRRDLATGAVECVSCRPNGMTGTDESGEPAMTPDGRIVAFQSLAHNFALGDTNALWGGWDAFVRDLDLAQPAVVAYCTAKVNSAGCLPVIGSSGRASVSGPTSLFVHATGVINESAGLLVWGPDQAALPFHGGTLCVAAPRTRAGAQGSGGTPAPALDCSGRYSFRVDAAYLAQHALPAGTTLYFQWYQRDRGFGAPDAVGLTGGLRATVAP